METDMMMELTIDPAGGVAAGRSKAPPVTTRVDQVPARQAHALPAHPSMRPAEDGREIGRGIVRAQEWHAAGRLLRRTEDAFAAVVLVGLLTLGALTFGYAFDSLATHQAASVPAVAVSE